MTTTLTRSNRSCFILEVDSVKVPATIDWLNANGFGFSVYRSIGNRTKILLEDCPEIPFANLSAKYPIQEPSLVDPSLGTWEDTVLFGSVVQTGVVCDRPETAQKIYQKPCRFGIACNVDERFVEIPEFNDEVLAILHSLPFAVEKV